MTKTKLFTLLGNYPNTLALKKGEVGSDLIDFDFAGVKVSNTAFKPLVREAKFDLGELAIVTFLQAKTYGKPYVLLPALVVARGQCWTTGRRTRPRRACSAWRAIAIFFSS